ncbi:MAG: GNAT family N-acetyltransferase [Ignavibacteriaceae bacterium]
MIEIHSAEEKDYDIINRLAHRIWPCTFGSILSKEQIDYMLEWMYSLPSIKEQVEKKGHHYILAKEDDNYIGYASFEFNYDNSDSTKVHKIYLLPETQGKGFGKQMMNYISEKALQNNNTSLLLNVNRDNPAVKFYERTGFRVIKEEDIDIGNNYFMNDYVMKKILK